MERLSHFLLLIFLIVLGAGTRLLADSSVEPIRVLLLDAPLPYHDFDRYLDLSRLKSVSIRDRDGGEMSLWDLNEREFARLQAGIPSAEMKDLMLDLEAFELLAHDGSLLSMVPGREDLLERLRHRPIHDSPYIQKLRRVGMFLHASAVANLIVSDADPSKLRLLHIPFVDSPERVAVSFQDIYFGRVEQYRENFRNRLEVVDRLIREGGVRIVNGSFGADVETVKSKILKNTFGITKKLFRGRIQKFAEALAEMQVQEFQAFVQSHPEVIFVLSAGNFRRSTEGVLGSFARVDGENLVLVAATNFQGELANFSSFSPEDIEIAAPGILIPSPTLGMVPSLRLSGTSMAAPLVTRRLAEILILDNKLSSKKAIEQLLRHETVALPRLANKVREGRFLLPQGLAGKPSWLIRQALPLLTEQTYFSSGGCKEALFRSWARSFGRVDLRGLPGVGGDPPSHE